MSRELISRRADLNRLVEEGYEIRGPFRAFDPASCPVRYKPASREVRSTRLSPGR